ncbi:MAG: MBL fold metallo-hydrolase [Desulfobulbaceae bacterium]|nr:MBL fold metallo-hydrolase [Desulfobulbaceae bacterium]
MRCIVLGSGSKGNATLVEAGSTRILIDNGFSGKELMARLRLVGIDPASLDAVLLTHEHNDHIGGVGVLARRLNIPVYANVSTHRAAENRLGRIASRLEFNTGEVFCLNDLQIHAFAITHDTADPVGFTLTDGLRTLGYCTDTGAITRLIRHSLSRCQALVLEANHDIALLRSGPYPLALQQRVLSSQGHLANVDALKLAAELAQGQLRRLVLAHLSEVNNHPELLIQEIERRNNELSGLDIVLARQDCVGPVLDLSVL